MSENQENPTQEQGIEYTTDLTDFLNAAKKENTEHKIEVLKKTPDETRKGKYHFEFLETYWDDIPSAGDIGREFGGGCFQLNVYYTDKKGKRRNTCRVIHISKRFDNKSPDPAAAPAGLAAGADNTTVAYLQLLQSQNNQMFQAMLTMMDKALNALNGPSKGGGGMDKIQNSLNKIMIDSAEQQQRLIGIMANKNLQDIDPEYEETEEDKNIFTFLKSLWDEYGETILKGTKQLQNLARKQAQGSEELKTVLSNPQAYAAAYEQLTEDANPADVDRLLEILGVPSPAELLNNTVPIQANE